MVCLRVVELVRRECILQLLRGAKLPLCVYREDPNRGCRAIAGFAILVSLAGLRLPGTDRIGRWYLSNVLMTFTLWRHDRRALSIIEVFVIRAICTLCAIDFILDVAILALAIALRRTGDKPIVDD